MSAALRPRGLAAKRILEILQVEPLSIREVAERMKIAKNSARYHLEKLQEQRKVHMDSGIRRVRRGQKSCVFVFGADAESAAISRGSDDPRPQQMTPARHELTAALLGEAPVKPLSQYVCHTYQQND